MTHDALILFLLLHRGLPSHSQTASQATSPAGRAYAAAPEI